MPWLRSISTICSPCVTPCEIGETRWFGPRNHSLSASRARIGDRSIDNLRMTAGYQLVLVEQLPAGLLWLSQRETSRRADEGAQRSPHFKHWRTDA